jgi:GT2 family glycosyltransferase
MIEPTKITNNFIEISVVIINFNSSQYSIECVKSIKVHSSRELNYEIIVVDNNSAQKDFESLKKGVQALNYKEVYIYRNKINAGFGGGNMYGFKKARGKYIVFVNNDVQLKNDCFSILKKAIEAHSGLGVCGPTTITSADKILPTLDFFASPLKFFFGRKIFKLIRPRQYQQRRMKLDQITFGDFVSGSFMFLESEVFKKAGGFDENIFLYHEETDLCLRLKAQGYKAACVPEALCFHHHGASTQKSPRIKAELKRSLLYVIRKHYGFVNYKIIKTIMQLKFAFKSIFSSKYKYLLHQISQPIDLNTSTKVTE